MYVVHFQWKCKFSYEENFHLFMKIERRLRAGSGRQLELPRSPQSSTQRSLSIRQSI